MSTNRSFKDYFLGEKPQITSPVRITNFSNANPSLLSQLISKEEEFDVSCDKIRSGLSSLSFSDSTQDFGSAAPELSSSPTDSVLSRDSQMVSPELNPIRIRPSTIQYGISSRLDGSEPTLRRAKTVAAAYPHLKPSRRSTHNTFKQVTSSSYNSLPSSDAVSFLSSFADSCELGKVAPDEEGEEVGNYVMGKVLAHGAFSTVREAFTMDHNGGLQKLAVKVIVKDPSQEQNEARLLELENEVMLWKQLHHSNLLQFMELVETDYAEFVFMELCPNGTLLDHVLSRGKLDESYARALFLQLADAVRYLHQDAHIVHCDLKLENVVLAEDKSLRLSDFGLSQVQHFGRPSSPRQDHPKGSLAYCSPELLGPNGVNSYASDIWALGVILFAMVTGQFPFADGFEPRLVMKIRSGNFNMPPSLSQPLTALLKLMLSPDPLLRPTIQDVLASPWCTKQNL
ncbi:hypothetical protein DSO57_1028462 [Entomophthora muscae]|uniref:Uncharacterized protein n=1 Tax=Entomophthora muscae TaxID=34485 RepID=A0ACC2TZZ1_9FUNG|nr:hypothetical protein DSO57_1028462 [Entomophthora muscae]